MRFDGEKFMKDVIKKTNKEMDKLAEELMQYMIYEVATIPYSGSPSAVGSPDWRADVIDALRWKNVNDFISVGRDVGIINQDDENLMMKAMIIEFGMGNDANTADNPWIAEYISSGYYHSERGGMRVYGRKGKETYDIDTDSWGMGTSKHNGEIPFFSQKGSEFWTKIFGNSATLARTRFDAIPMIVMESMNFAKYVRKK